MCGTVIQFDCIQTSVTLFQETNNDMRIRFHKLSPIFGVLLMSALVTLPTFGAGKTVTLTGEIGDAMCGNKHQMEGSPAECTRDCVSHGSKYALVVGDKVYTLETTDKATLSKLSDLAGQRAKVTGTAEETTIQVASVAPSK